jgi:hypothetical protein
MRRLFLLLVLLLVPTFAEAGYRNVLISIESEIPATLGGTALLKITTQNDGQPLANQECWLTLYRPKTTFGEWTKTEWAVRTNARGVAKLYLPIFNKDRTGWWIAGVRFIDPQWGDGDAISFPVEAP